MQSKQQGARYKYTGNIRTPLKLFSPGKLVTTLRPRNEAPLDRLLHITMSYSSFSTLYLHVFAIFSFHNNLSSSLFHRRLITSFTALTSLHPCLKKRRLMRSSSCLCVHVVLKESGIFKSYWVSGLCPSSGFQNEKKVSETGCFPP
jgi:hypothetical protein